MICCKALLPRAGLGNRLFPWARCRVYSLKHAVPMLPVRWFQMKVGPMLRGESDRRLYHGLFRKDRERIPRWEHLAISLFGHRVSEPEDLDWTPPMDDRRRCVVVFEGERDHFQRLRGWHQVLHEQLTAMTRDKWLVGNLHLGTTYPIGIHVRCGDFLRPKSAAELYTSGGVRTPLEWFVESLRWIREQVGEAVGAFVVSDGKPAELEPLLAEPNVIRLNSGSAVGDLLSLAKASVLIASGGSSFSGWACFLGQMPTVSHPGQSLQWFKLGNEKGVYVGEFDPRGAPPADLGEQVQTVLRKRSEAEVRNCRQ